MTALFKIEIFSYKKITYAEISPMKETVIYMDRKMDKHKANWHLRDYANAYKSHM
jgi:hypothetical protein